MKAIPKGIASLVILTATMNLAQSQETQQWGSSAILPTPPGDSRYSIVVDAAGFSYVGGVKEVSAGVWDFMVAKFDAAGVLVPAFGAAGILTIDTGGISPNDDEIASDLKMDDAGRLYISGSRGNYDPVTGMSNSVIVVTRITAAGTVDTTWNTTGTAVFPLPVALTNALDEGMAVESGATPRVYVVGDASNTDALLIRFDATGAVDTTFDTDGYLTWDNAGNLDVFGGAVVDAAGNIYVNGQTKPPGGTGGPLPADGSDVIVRKYDSTGVPVGAFGTAGTVTYAGTAGLGDGSERCVVKGGFLYVCGSTNVGISGSPDHATLILKIDGTTGAFDTTFGTGGAVVYNSTGVQRLFAVDVDLAAKPHVSGVTPNPLNPSDEDLLVLKYNADGTLDTSFDSDGIFTQDSGALDGGEGIRVGNSFHVVTRWGSGVRAMYFAAPAASVPARKKDNCGLLGAEILGLLGLILLARGFLRRA